MLFREHSVTSIFMYFYHRLVQKMSSACFHNPADLQSWLVYVVLLRGSLYSELVYWACADWIVCTAVEQCVPLRVLDYRGRASHLSHLSPETTYKTFTWQVSSGWVMVERRLFASSFPSSNRFIFFSFFNPWRCSDGVTGLNPDTRLRERQKDRLIKLIYIYGSDSGLEPGWSLLCRYYTFMFSSVKTPSLVYRLHNYNYLMLANTFKGSKIKMLQLKSGLS